MVKSQDLRPQQFQPKIAFYCSSFAWVNWVHMKTQMMMAAMIWKFHVHIRGFYMRIWFWDFTTCSESEINVDKSNSGGWPKIYIRKWFMSTLRICMFAIRFGCNDMWMLIGDGLFYGRFTFISFCGILRVKWQIFVIIQVIKSSKSTIQIQLFSCVVFL